MEESKNQSIEAARQELVILQSEIEALKAKKSIVQCIREAYSKELPVRVLKRKVHKPIGSKEPPTVEITISEADYQQLMEMAKSAAWIDTKLLELKRLGDQLWRQMNQSAILKDAIQRAEEAELRCRKLAYQLTELQKSQESSFFQHDSQSDSADREMEYSDHEDFER